MPVDNLPAELLHWPVEWLRIVPPPEVERITTLSWDTVKPRGSDRWTILSGWLRSATR
jgi:hypothetical protein